jgi:hypothetical protein
VNAADARRDPPSSPRIDLAVAGSRSVGREAEAAAWPLPGPGQPPSWPRARPNPNPDVNAANGLAPRSGSTIFHSALPLATSAMSHRVHLPYPPRPSPGR